MNLPIYMDGHATTRVDPRVLAAMLPFFDEYYGNAASRHHRFGWDARDAVADARAAVADLIGATARELVFTSGATESNNLALKGVADASRDRGNHVVTVQTEHRAVLDPCARLERQGAEVSYLPVRTDGLLDPVELAAAITSKTVLVTVMMANNEIGVLQPVADLANVAQARGVPFHTDAAQAAGKVPIDVSADGIDLLSLTAHKLYGPKGVGALYVRRRVRIDATTHGGGHEHNMRSGTLNVAGIVGFGVAAELAAKQRDDDAERSTQLTSELVASLTEQLDGVEVIPESAPRLPNTINVRFTGADAEAVMVNAPTVAVSSGSACTSMVPHPSHVLIAMGMSADDASECLRFSTGRPTTSEDITEAVAALVPAVTRVRELTR